MLFGLLLEPGDCSLAVLRWFPLSSIRLEGWVWRRG